MLDFYCMFKGCVNELPVHPACLTLRHKTAVRPAAINYHLKTVVFPAEMKEFPHKLFLLWPIHITTISQCDLPPQLPRHAVVLECLLRPENSFITTRNTSVDGTLNADALIQIAVESDPQYPMMLDVGAQVIELHNEEVAQIWLERSSPADIQAAIFFDHQNELCVLSRDGEKESLLISDKGQARSSRWLSAARERCRDIGKSICYNSLEIHLGAPPIVPL
ncbi:hypothetical protein V8E51_007487 [Hyaloscypha variabilis]